MGIASQDDDRDMRMHVSADKMGIALVLLPALAGWALIVVVVVAQLFFGSAAGLVGFLSMGAFVIAMAILASRDATRWGMEGGSSLLFILLLFIVGYPVHMSSRAKRGAPLGLGAGLCGLALMFLPLLILPLGASLLARKVAASEASRPPPAVVAPGKGSSPSDAAAWQAAMIVDRALCSSTECSVGLIGDKAKAILEDPKNANKRVRMESPSQPQLATLANAPGTTKLTIGMAFGRPGGFYEHATNLSPIGKLGQLEELDDADTDNLDLTGLEPLIHLEKLQVENGNLTSLKGLGSLINLKSLQLPLGGASGIKDLSTLEPLVNLQALTLRNGTSVDLAPLAGLGSLRSLTLMFFHTTSVKPLRGLTGLRSLALSGSDLSDTDALSSLTTLDSLTLWAKVSAIPFVAGMKAISHIDADDNPDLKDIAPLKGLVALTSLELNNTGVTDLTPLASCPHLRTLSIRRTKAKNLAPLSSLKELVTLNLAGIDGVDLMPLAKMPALKTVTLFTGQVPDAAIAAFRAAAPKVTLLFSKP
jgi:Leucine-rich repeat (LRR) protein